MVRRGAIYFVHTETHVGTFRTLVTLYLSPSYCNRLQSGAIISKAQRQEVDSFFLVFDVGFWFLVGWGLSGL